MSIIDSAKRELDAINFGDEDSTVMLDLLRRFLDQWDSGAAVAIVAPVFQKLLAGKPLSPLTGADSEWMEVTDGVFQNLRCSTVFKDPRFHEGKWAYDLDNPAGSRVAIEFPYMPKRADIQFPVYEIETDAP